MNIPFGSIRSRLIAIILIVAMLTIVPTYILSGWLKYKSLKRELAQNVIVNARLVSEYCISPLAFEDRQGASDILMKLARIDYIQGAWLYDRNDGLFAAFHRLPSMTEPPKKMTECVRGTFSGNRFCIAVPVMFQKEPYGKITIQAETTGIAERTKKFLLTLLPGSLMILGLAVLLAVYLQKGISGPITQLAGITRRISTLGDDTIRAPSRNPADEIGQLYSGFNNMLEHLSLRKRQRDQAVLKLQQSENRFREMVEKISDWVWETDTEGRFCYSSPAVAAIIGYAPEDLSGRLFTDFVPEESRLEAMGVFREMVKREKEISNVIRTLLHKDGSEVFLESSAHPVYAEGSDGPSGYRGIDRDITKRILAEKEKSGLEHQLRQSQKMESVGRLAGGVAHDFNNILSAIIGYSEFSLMDIDKGHPLHERLGIILESAHRAARLTHQLLAFSRKQIMKKETLNVRQEIDSLFKMISRLLGEDIDIRVNHGAEDFLIHADRSQLEQVILNLSINARDAMPRGGQLVIETEGVELKEGTMGHHCEIEPGAYVRIVVSDTGEGIPAEIMDNIFEPFFTTKDRGRGTGLGLSTVYGIIKQNQGDIDVYSEKEKGTAFKIYLPRVDGDAASDAGGDCAEAPSPVPCTGTILLVEDDAVLRAMIRKTLADMGYDVVEAEDGSKGEAEFYRNEGKIDLLFTDLIMPGKNGVELAAGLRGRFPGLKVVLMSGYAENSMILSHGMDAGMHFIQKPITPQSISRAVRKLL